MKSLVCNSSGVLEYCISESPPIEECQKITVAKGSEHLFKCYFDYLGTLTPSQEAPKTMNHRACKFVLICLIC